MINVLKLELSNLSRTAKFWVQYLGYVKILKEFIRAERTGNWSLHLLSVSRMINLFAATGHVHYAKCPRLYLLQMLELETMFNDNGYHTVRQSDKFWAGLWTDLIIEQVMMRSHKSRGGLTRGRGIHKTVRTMWICSSHRCAGIHEAMTNLTGIKHRTSEQHVELGASRQLRDTADLKKIIFGLKIGIHFNLLW